MSGEAGGEGGIKYNEGCKVEGSVGLGKIQMHTRP